MAPINLVEKRASRRVFLSKRSKQSNQVAINLRVNLRVEFVGHKASLIVRGCGYESTQKFTRR